MAEKLSCAGPGAKVEGGKTQESAPMAEKREAAPRCVTVAMKAPDFTAPAYLKGEFTRVTLSDHLGRWVALCFYPGDFTFV